MPPDLVFSRKAVSKPSSLTDKLHRLGLRQPIDFLLHLPLRDEDEAGTVPIASSLSIRNERKALLVQSLFHAVTWSTAKLEPNPAW